MEAEATLVILRSVPRLPPRDPEGHKGTYGRVLVVAGSRGMSGAAILCGRATLRGGAGLVQVAAPEGIVPVVAGADPCYLTAPLPEDEHGRLGEEVVSRLLPLVEASKVMVMGPGLGESETVARLILEVLRRTRVRLVLDADALNSLVGRLDELAGALEEQPGRVVLTPHPGEFARLAGTDIASVQDRRRDHAARLAGRLNAVVVLKGRGTVVTDGHYAYLNTTGNPGMATGGTGDVLAGLIAALCAQGLEGFAAAQLGVHLHGLAGDLARDDLGEVSLIASDLLTYLPKAFSAHAAAKE
jgi:ADP-dependent NAD(P)H-hydrate dehydratase